MCSSLQAYQPGDQKPEWEPVAQRAEELILVSHDLTLIRIGCESRCTVVNLREDNFLLPRFIFILIFVDIGV